VAVTGLTGLTESQPLVQQSVYALPQRGLGGDVTPVRSQASGKIGEIAVYVVHVN
jgi:hypothetical protein